MWLWHQTSSTTNADKEGGRGGGSDNGFKGGKTVELLHEATQLLKTLRVPAAPTVKVMQIGGLDHADANMVLIDFLAPLMDFDLPEILRNGSKG